MDKLKPVEWQFQDSNGKWCNFINDEHRRATMDSDLFKVRPLYTEPQYVNKTCPVDLTALEQHATDAQGTALTDNHRKLIKKVSRALRDKKGSEYGPSWFPGTGFATDMADKLESMLSHTSTPKP